jgi:hypothetical protein
VRISWCYLKEILFQMNIKMLINLVLKSDCQSVGAIGLKRMKWHRLEYIMFSN